ncbi:MAG: N-acetylglucosamine-6-phosphate deacetylase, partial [Pygmaiobacter sp.]
MKIQNAKVFTPHGTFTTGTVAMAGERFAENAEGDVLDATGLYAIPGLVDVHFHGCVGYDFCDGTQQATAALADYEAQNGITSICPATMTYPFEKLDEIFRTAAAYRSEHGARLVGINMEGPFISLAKKGAQNAEYIHAPSVELFRRLQASANGLVKLLDIAPEAEGAMELISALSGEVGISLAHTMADYDTASEAYRRGARQATHLYNAMPPFSHRAPGVVGAALDA